MHIQEGVLSNTPAGVAVLGAGVAVTAVGTAVGLRRMDYDSMPRVAVLTSAFFVASLVHLPLGPTSVHLVLNGLAGVILGWACFPAFLVALLLQAILLGFGGLTTLGLNTANMALPAMACYMLFNSAVRCGNASRAFRAGFAAGALGILGGASLTAFALLAGGEGFAPVMKMVIAAHLPVMVAEGIVTGQVAAFLHRVRPEMLQGTLRREREPALG